MIGEVCRKDFGIFFLFDAQCRKSNVQLILGEACFILNVLLVRGSIFIFCRQRAVHLQYLREVIMHV